MHIKADTLDDLLREVFEHLVESTDRTTATRGSFTELFGVVLHLTNPLARLSRSEMKGKVFSALGELLWYLSGANDYAFIDYYVPGRYKDETEDGLTVRSGYGERLFRHRGVNQLQNVIALLKKKQTTRRATIQLFDASDLEQDYASIPCTCTLQFLARHGKLSMFVSMRSNDAYLGLPHDVFAFTMLQELVARTVGLELGEYKHAAGSLHLYDEQVEAARAYLGEAWQATVAMPAMPRADPWPAVEAVRAMEVQLRGGQDVDLQAAGLDDYWTDLCRLLAAFRAAKRRDAGALRAVSAALAHDSYRVFVDARVDKLGQDAAPLATAGEGQT